MGIFSNNNQKGQIILIVVLAAVVSLTVGLAAVSRTITNTKISTEEASSQKALSAAEAGIEKLITVSDVTLGSAGTLSNSANFNATANAVSGSNPIELNCGRTAGDTDCAYIYQDDGADVWLSKYPDFSSQWNGALFVYWTDNDTDCTKNAAVEIVIISGKPANPTDKTDPIFTKDVYDACGSRSTGNHFPAPSSGTWSINGTDYKHRFSIPVVNGFIARVIPLYANAKIAVRGANLPSQGNVLRSVGKSGNTTRVVRVYKGYPRIPIEFFPYNLFLP